MVHIGGSHVAKIVLTVLAVLMAILVLVTVSRKGYRIICYLSSVISWICYSLIFYVIGVAFSAYPTRDDQSALFACFVLLFVGLAKSFLSNSIHEIRSASYQQLLQMVFVLVLILVRRSWSMRLSFVPAMLLIALCFIWVVRRRSHLLSASARKCIKEDLLISEYMATRHNDKEAFDPTELKGVNYIVSDVITSTRYRGLLRIFLEPLLYFGTEVRGLKKRVSDLLSGARLDNLRCESTPSQMVNRVIRYDNLVTVEDIWKHMSPTRSDGKSSEGMDICMSFALFKLLRRRFRGCYLHESGLVKTRDFVLRGLLSESPDPRSSKIESPDPLRAFHIVEAELGFLFDFFYINHLPDLIYAICICIFLVWTSSVWTIFLLAKTGQNDLDMQIPNMNQLSSAVLLMFPLTGLWELCSLAGSNRLKVNLLVYICQRRKRESLSSKWPLDSILASFPSTGCYWSNRARMYCLFQGDSPIFSTRQISNYAKKALLNALKLRLELDGGILHDGRRSLSRNSAKELSWACDQEFVAEKILVWHIATTLCHVGGVIRSTERKNHETATMLSGYCAYLVGFAPELIADDIYATRLVFDNGRAAALKCLEGEGSLATIHEWAAMMELQTTDFAATTTQHDVVFQGKMLAAQLIKLSAHGINQWKVLSEFWAELMLFISPADNAAAHLESLKTGGELITHTWALLTHAGILAEMSTPGTKQSSTQDRLAKQRTAVKAGKEIEVAPARS